MQCIILILGQITLKISSPPSAPARTKRAQSIKTVGKTNITSPNSNPSSPKAESARKVTVTEDSQTVSPAHRPTSALSITGKYAYVMHLFNHTLST